MSRTLIEALSGYPLGVVQHFTPSHEPERVVAAVNIAEGTLDFSRPTRVTYPLKSVKAWPENLAKAIADCQLLDAELTFAPCPECGRPVPQPCRSHRPELRGRAADLLWAHAVLFGHSPLGEAG
jgi:hypothetical protein